jgi:hypothetical protein
VYPPKLGGRAAEYPEQLRIFPEEPRDDATEQTIGRRSTGTAERTGWLDLTGSGRSGRRDPSSPPGPAVRPPSWQSRVVATRAAVVRPGPAPAIAATVAAALPWLVVVAYGVDHLPLIWTLLAFAAGAGGMVLALRGFPVPGVAAVLGGVVCWGLATRNLVPQSALDLLGDVRLFGWNLAFAAPLQLVYLGCVRVDARRAAQAEVRSIADERRWWGSAGGDNEPQLAALEAIPSARFFAVPGQVCTHLVVAGRRAALVGATVWPAGDYRNDQSDVLRNGRFFGPGTDDAAALMADARTWVTRFAGSTVACRAYLVVHPASERPADEVRLALPTTEHAELVESARFVDVVGEFLLREPYRIDVEVFQLLMDRLTGERVGSGDGRGAGRPA